MAEGAPDDSTNAESKAPVMSIFPTAPGAVPVPVPVAPSFSLVVWLSTSDGVAESASFRSHFAAASVPSR